uniref:CSON003339 protein n=1 Tax=Culicoides sonorensis TaxID=179676 RepID=A0A336LJI2_CULSO
MSNRVEFNSETKTWSGPKVPYPFGNKSTGQVIYESMKTNLNHICQVSDDSGEIYTNERMLKEAISFANHLKLIGIKRGDTAIMLTHNHHYMAPTWLGCVFAGVLICPFGLIEGSVKEEIIELVNQLKPSFMVTSYINEIQRFKEVFKQLNVECPIYIYDNQFEDCFDLKPLLETKVNIYNFKPVSIINSDTDIFMITLSSATTSKPKLINVTHKQFLLGGLDQVSNYTIATTLIPGWQTEAVILFNCLQKCHRRIIRAFHNEVDFLKLLEKHKVTFAFVKPRDIFMMTNSDLIKSIDLSELIIVVSFGAHLAPVVANNFKQYIPNGIVVSIFGMSEIGMSVADASDIEENIPNLVGKVKRNMHLRVRGENSNQYLGPNEIGEICVKADASFGGYYKNAKLTEANTTRDGFFLTDDLGYLDKEGNIFLVDRRKYVFSYRGNIIQTTQIEQIIREHVRGVENVCVVDIEHEEHGLYPVIAIVPQVGAELDEHVIVDTVMKNHPFKFETKVFFMKQFPMTISGKIKKHVVRSNIKKLEI